MIITEQMFTVKGLDRADIGLSGSAFFCGRVLKIVRSGNRLLLQASNMKDPSQAQGDKRWLLQPQ